MKTVFYARIEIEHDVRKTPTEQDVCDQICEGVQSPNDVFLTQEGAELDQQFAQERLNELVRNEYLIVKNPADPEGKRFADVVAFAKSVGALPEFAAKCEYLAEYGLQDGTERDVKCHLYHDFAPHSFGFAVMRKGRDEEEWKQQMVGGLIYSGPEQPLDGSAPALTVSVSEPKATHSWSVHT